MSNDEGDQRVGARVLYLTYDGLTDPLGRSQVLPYMMRLAERGHSITILSCEKPKRMDKDGARIRKLCEAAGLEWHPLVYHKWPPVLSTVYDLKRLEVAAVALQKRIGFDLVHCRGHFPAIVGLHLKRRFGTALVFDPRGYWPDEKVEAGVWNVRNPVYARVYRYFKALEDRLYRDADEIVFLTEAGKENLLTRPDLRGQGERITVIPCCVAFDDFPLVDAQRRGDARTRLGLPAEAAVLLYLGSIGAWYMLEEMLDFFRIYQARHPGARFLFVTPDEPQAIRNEAAARGIDPEALVIVAASREEVPGLMAAADLGLCLIRPLFSKTGSSPTKLGEMVALGLPVVANYPVGDVEQIVRESGCGVAIEALSPESYDRAIEQAEALPTSPADRRRAALPWFDLNLGVDSYDRLYRRCLAGQAEERA